ncbi:hypothetical protein GCM10009641_06730 [Mycobacterium cookii]|uniref:Uncharacterized protein n=1 Tax=Mycobacterium cookii TaxID=1775 RepID=A0A7I7L3X7_9MYCO|nr:hypothetical protein [Mycobacterium cookii]MCV7333007.1 hypothetical protein [Mycobacterium cookii]BBX48282.1 hypothetical protein MCOO_42970 [Mycobacterium cookii]
MADRLDVAGRLAEGRQAVEHTQTYVQACHALGYQQPDLTAHAGQVEDWYDAESGLDLKALDGDCATLRAAVNAVEEALFMQRTQVTELAAGWRGSGADAAAGFVQRHCDVAADVAAHVRSAAEGCAALRDNLWQLVDGKVATTVAIDDRRAAQRPAWLSAAHTVVTGEGDRSVADDLIRQQVIPYVDDDIRNDWLAAMHSTTASIARSYDTAIHALTSTPEVAFEIPGELGPKRQPTSGEPVGPAPTAQTLPDIASPAATVPAAAQAQPSPTMPEPQPLSDDPPEVSGTPLDDLSGLSTGAGGLGGLGGIAGGIGGVIGSIVDGIGSLIGSLAGGLGDAAGSGDPLLDDEPVDTDDIADDPEEAADPEPTVPDDTAVPEEPVEQLAESPPAAVEAVNEPAAPPPIDPPAADQPAPLAGPPPDGSTPCEIAEDQLPQAGQ